MSSGILIETDILLSFLLPGDEPSLLRLLLQETLCYTTFLQAAELYSCVSTPEEELRIKPALFAVRILGASARYAPTIGRIMRDSAALDQTPSLREAVIASIAREARLPIITEKFSKKYQGIPDITIIEAGIVRHHLNCRTLPELLASVRLK